MPQDIREWVALILLLLNALLSFLNRQQSKANGAALEEFSGSRKNAGGH